MVFVKHQTQTISGNEYEYYYLYQSYYNPSMNNPTNFKVGKVDDSIDSIMSSYREKAEDKDLDISADEFESFRDKLEHIDQNSNSVEEKAEMIKEYGEDPEDHKDDNKHDSEDQSDSSSDNDDLPERAEQHALVAPVKVAWSGKTRDKFRTRVEDVDILDPVFESQKTNIVVETEEQVNELLFRLHAKVKAEGKVWSANNQKAIKRVHDEIVEQLEDQGYVIENHKIQDLEETSNSSVKNEGDLPEGLDTDKLEEYLEEFTESLETEEDELNSSLPDERMKLVIDKDESVDKRRNQIIEAFEEGIDTGTIKESVKKPEKVREYDGDWVFAWRPKNKQNDRYVEINEALENAVVTDDEASVKNVDKYDVGIDDATSGDLGSVRSIIESEGRISYDELYEKTDLGYEDQSEALEKLEQLELIEEVEDEVYEYIGSDKINDRDYEDLLSQSIPDVKDDLDEISLAEYEDILEEEKDNKDRKGIKKFLKKQLRENTMRSSDNDVEDMIWDFIHFALRNDEYPQDKVEREIVIDSVLTENRPPYLDIDEDRIEEILENMIESGDLVEEDGFINLPSGSKYARSKDEVLEFIEDKEPVSPDNVVSEFSNRAEINEYISELRDENEIELNQGQLSVKNDSDDDGMNEDAVKKLTSKGVMVGKDASETITDDDVEMIMDLEALPMYVDENVLREIKGEEVSVEYDEVEITGEVPEFYAIDGDIYGNYDGEERVTLPEDNAEILVNRGLAERVEEEDSSVKNEDDDSMDTEDGFDELQETEEIPYLRGVWSKKFDYKEIAFVEARDDGKFTPKVKDLEQPNREEPITGSDSRKRKFDFEKAKELVDDYADRNVGSKGEIIIPENEGEFSDDLIDDSSSGVEENTRDKEGYVKVEFLQKTPQFMGTDLEQYGGFEKGDVAEIPEENAEILENRGNVEIVQEDEGNEDLPPESESNSDDGFDTEALDKLRDLIHDLDDGDGADYKEVVEKEFVDDDLIDDLKRTGDIYEPMQGKLKLIDYNRSDGDLTKEEAFDAVNDRDYKKLDRDPEYAFSHNATNKNIHIMQEDGEISIYGNIVGILRENDVIDTIGSKKDYEDKEEALDDLRLMAMHFNNNYGEYLDDFQDEGSVDDKDMRQLEDKVVDYLDENFTEEGNGVKYETLKSRKDGIGNWMEINGFTEDMLEDAINNLLSDGTLYEPAPGRVKKL